MTKVQMIQKVLQSDLGDGFAAEVIRWIDWIDRVMGFPDGASDSIEILIDGVIIIANRSATKLVVHMDSSEEISIIVSCNGSDVRIDLGTEWTSLVLRLLKELCGPARKTRKGRANA